jgi:hypothetical protein
VIQSIDISDLEPTFISGATLTRHNILDAFNYRVVWFADSHAPGTDNNCGLHSSDCHLRTKLTGYVIHCAPCFLGLNQHTYP